MSQDNRTATQKIEDLEKVCTVLYQASMRQDDFIKNLPIPNIQQDMALVKEALKLLNKKTEAIIQVANSETGITVAAVSALVTKMNVEDLVAQVAGHVAAGNLTPADEVAADSFVVCDESTPDGTLANPRIQFRLDSQDQATQDALKGKKVGDSVSFGDNKFTAKILEVYSLTQPKAPEAAAPEAVVPEAAPEAPLAVPVQEALPEESPVTFGLKIHGEDEPAGSESLMMKAGS